MARYEPTFIIRFEGTLTQGPFKGESHTFDTSWGGAGWATEAEAREKLAEYRRLEPDLKYKLLSRLYTGGKGKKVKFTETEVPI